jgi:probable rRNA maturation factor
LSRRAIAAKTTRILSALGFDGAVVEVAVCDDPAIRILNRVHRRIDRATDVLSFPQEEMREGVFVSKSPAARSWAAGGPAAGPPFTLGDVVISAESVERQAAVYGVSFSSEFDRVLLHGVLHLLGWDHMKPGERVRMRAFEEMLLKAGIPG